MKRLSLVRASVGGAFACGVFGVAFGAELRANIDLIDRGIPGLGLPSPLMGPNAAGGVAQNRNERAHPGNPLWGMPLSSLATTRERPIFSPSRRPPPPVVVAPSLLVLKPPPPAPPEPGHPLLTLMGTVVGNDGGIGIFVNQVDKTVLRLKTGRQHEGWILRSVQGREAIFEKDNRAKTLSLPPRRSSNPQPDLSFLAPGAPPQPAVPLVDGSGPIITPPSRRPSSSLQVVQPQQGPED